MLIENQIIHGDSLDILKTFPAKSVDCCITSPPYFQLRDYGMAGQIGLEKTPEEYIIKLSSIFCEVWRVLKDEGTLWINIGDSYGRGSRGTANTSKSNSKHNYHYNQFPANGNTNANKSLTAIPFRFVLAMISNGWILRQDIIWAKPSPMPESVKDRFCKSHEYLFFFVKQPKYYFNFDTALEPATGYDCRKDTKYKGGVKDMAGGAHERWPHRGYAFKDEGDYFIPQGHGINELMYPLRLKRDVWYIPTEPSNYKHYAMFPQKLIIPCVLCGCPENGIVLDPFMGSGTTAVVAKKLMRKYIGCEINFEYIKISEKRLADEKELFDEN